MKPKVFILDVDGVMTTGQFFYSAEGKAFKSFGPDDNDGLSLLKTDVEIRFVTGDKKGFHISKKRIVEDMGYPLDLVSTIRRVEWIEDKYNLDSVIYMGDGIFDHLVMKKALYSIVPNGSLEHVSKSANFITKNNPAQRAVAEAVIHILKYFFSVNFSRLKKIDL